MADIDSIGLPTPETAWTDVWEPIIVEDGEINLDTVKSLLFDYGACLHSNAILYPYITNSRITHPQHDVEEVIEVSDEEVANVLDDGIHQVLGNLLDTLEDVGTEPPEVQLSVLISRINALYEKPVV